MEKEHFFKLDHINENEILVIQKVILEMTLVSTIKKSGDYTHLKPQIPQLANKVDKNEFHNSQLDDKKTLLR